MSNNNMNTQENPWTPPELPGIAHPAPTHPDPAANVPGNAGHVPAHSAIPTPLPGAAPGFDATNPAHIWDALSFLGRLAEGVAATQAVQSTTLTALMQQLSVNAPRAAATRAPIPRFKEP